jgi:hypothetical protein
MSDKEWGDRSDLVSFDGWLDPTSSVLLGYKACSSKKWGHEWIVYICFVLCRVMDIVKVIDDLTLKTEIEKCG